MSNARTNLSDGKKKYVAGSQQYRCANFLNPGRIGNYVCPMGFRPESKGNFDQSGYEIDHITEVAEDGTNDFSNLQALCLCCHRVKTNLYNMNRRSTQTVSDEESDSVQEFVISDETRPRRSNEDMKYYIKDGQEVLVRYNEKEYAGIYHREDNCIQYDGKLYGSLGAFRKAVIESTGGVTNSKSGKGWQRCYVRDESGAEKSIGNLPLLE